MTNTYGTFSEVRARLDEILVEVRKKDLSLEKSLDLYEEAIKLANRCSELVDKSDFSKEEAAAAAELLSQEISVSLGAEVSNAADSESDNEEVANEGAASEDAESEEPSAEEAEEGSEE